MSFHPSHDWGSPPQWSSSQASPWATYPVPSDGGVGSQMYGQGGHTPQAWASYQPMPTDGPQFYSAGPEAQINDPSSYEIGMDVDYPSPPGEPADVEMASETSSAPYYLEEPRTPPRRPLSRVATVTSKITKYLSPSKSSRSQSPLKATTNTTRRNPLTPYTTQRTQRKPILSHANLVPRLSDGSVYYPPITPRRLKNRRYARFLAREVNELTDRLCDLTIASADADAGVAKHEGTVSDSASMLSDAGSDATLAPSDMDLDTKSELEFGRGMRGGDFKEMLLNLLDKVPP